MMLLLSPPSPPDSTSFLPAAFIPLLSQHCLWLSCPFSRALAGLCRLQWRCCSSRRTQSRARRSVPKALSQTSQTNLGRPCLWSLYFSLSCRAKRNQSESRQRVHRPRWWTAIFLWSLRQLPYYLFRGSLDSSSSACKPWNSSRVASRFRRDRV